MRFLYLLNIYKIIFIFLALNVINVLSEYETTKEYQNISVLSLSSMEVDNYDITTIYKIIDWSNTSQITSVDDGFKNKDFGSNFRDKYKVLVRPRTNAVRLPIIMDYLNNDTIPSSDSLFEDNEFIQFSSYELDDWNLTYTTNTGDSCDPETNNYLSEALQAEDNNIECLKVMEYISMYAMKKYEYETFLNITWKPQKNLNSLAFEYVFRPSSLYNIIIYIFDENNKQHYFHDVTHSVNRTTLIIENKQFKEEKIYTLMIVKHYTNVQLLPEFKTYFGVYQITSLHITDDEGEYNTMLTIFQDHLEHYPIPFHVVGSSTSDIRNTPNNNTISKSNCLNGGYKIVNQILCICPPGFKGGLCEIGCGPNTYGADCNGVCSFYKKGCVGMYLCTSNFGCTCPTGLTGPLCNQKCPPNKYGNDCKQNCSSTCFNKTCNRFTGVCSKGCSSPYIPPACVEKYTYLLSGPELDSVGHNDITININFNMDNLNSEHEYSFLKHYQIIYKTPEDTIYTYSKSKQLHLNEVKKETLQNLKSKETYTVGVLLIRSDGHYNDQDIVFKNYTTTCKIPEWKTKDYNINTTQESSTIKVTWDEMPLTPENCRITEYILSLKNKNNEDHHFLTNYHIEDTNSTSHNIEDLIVGNEYILSLTPWIDSIALPSSPDYNITLTLPDHDHDIGIIDIQANAMGDNHTIQVSWNIINYDQANSAIIPPIIVKYKIHRMYSCSFNEVINDWTSEKIYGRKNYEIANVTSNTQYIIQVILNNAEDTDENIDQQKTELYAITPVTKPSIKPFFVEPLQMGANNSVTVKWAIDPKNCTSLNGEFSGFFVELISKNDSQQFYYNKTEEFHHDSLYNLKSDTDYEIKVHVLNEIGYDTKYFLSKTFSTKIIYPVINDLMIYKKSKNNRMLGLRWKFLNTTNIKICKISLCETNSSCTNEMDIVPEICQAWPGYHCYINDKLDLKNVMKIKVKALDTDDLERINESLVPYKSLNEVPYPPSNFCALNITDTTMSLHWDIPWVLNGLLKSFIIQIEDISPVGSQQGSQTLTLDVKDEQPTYSYNVTSLNPGSTYSIDVVALTTHYSTPTTIEITTLKNAPSIK